MHGLRDIAPVMLATVPFGLVFGALATKEGLSVGESLLMSGLVYAGSSQFVALEFWAHPLPFWTILFSVLAVNLRHVLYSAALGRKMGHWSPAARLSGFALLVDPTFAIADLKGGPRLSAAYYFGLFAAALCQLDRHDRVGRDLRQPDPAAGSSWPRFCGDRLFHLSGGRVPPAPECFRDRPGQRRGLDARLLQRRPALAYRRRRGRRDGRGGGSDRLAERAGMTDELAAIVLIASLGLATYGTRIAGHLVLSRFDRLDPRIDAALDAVPAAVMTCHRRAARADLRLGGSAGRRGHRDGVVPPADPLDTGHWNRRGDSAAGARSLMPSGSDLGGVCLYSPRPACWRQFPGLERQVNTAVEQHRGDR